MNVTPLIVGLTGEAPSATAPIKVPAVLMSLSPLMFVAAPHVITAACVFDAAATARRPARQMVGCHRVAGSAADLPAVNEKAIGERRSTTPVIAGPITPS